MTIKIVHIISGLKDGGAEAILYNFISKSNSKRVNHIVISLRNGGKYGKLLEEKELLGPFDQLLPAVCPCLFLDQY